MMVRATLAAGQQEAMPVSSQAPLLRDAAQPPPHDAAVPGRAFADDVQRKAALRRVMGPRPDALRETPQPRFEKDDVNYRYASDETRSCDECVHFRKNGSCELVAGLIRRVDTCDQWKGVNEPFGVFRGQREPLGPVQATLVTGASEGWDDDPFDTDPFADCDPDEQDFAGRCPDDPSYSGPEDPFGDDWGEAKGGPPRARFVGRETAPAPRRRRVTLAPTLTTDRRPTGVSARAFSNAKRRTAKDAGWVSSTPMAGAR